MAGAKKTNKKVVKSTTNVHVVVFSCPDCTHEVEEVKLCPECGKPMRVINVVEKFGDEAEEYIKKFKQEGKKDEEKEDGDILDVDAPTIIKLSDDDHIEDSDDEEDASSLGVIYPDDDQSNTSSEGADMDFMEALEKLDEEDEDPGELNELPEL